MDLRDIYLNPKPVGCLDKTQVSPGKIKFDTTERFVGLLVDTTERFVVFLVYLSQIYTFIGALFEGHLSYSELLASRKK